MLIFIGFALCTAICFAMISSVASMTEGQHAAENWSNDKRYAQISCYTSENSGIYKENINYMYQSFNSILQEASITAEEDARLWVDAYSYETSGSVNTDKANVSVSVTVFGGDFFVFHPFELVSGDYFVAGSSNPDSVVIDDYTAWQLYGATDVAGMDLYYNGRIYKIIGVVKKGSGDVYERCYGEYPRIYINTYGVDLNDGYNPYKTYEILFPNPVSGFASDSIKKALGISEKEAIYIENSERFDLLPLYKTIGELGTRSIKDKAFILPYWENVAAVATDKCAVIQIFASVFAFGGFVSFIVFAVLFIRNLVPVIKNKYEKVSSKLERERTKKYYNKKHRSLVSDNVTNKEKDDEEN